MIMEIEFNVKIIEVFFLANIHLQQTTTLCEIIILNTMETINNRTSR